MGRGGGWRGGGAMIWASRSLARNPRARQPKETRPHLGAGLEGVKYSGALSSAITRERLGSIRTQGIPTSFAEALREIFILDFGTGDRCAPHAHTLTFTKCHPVTRSRTHTCTHRQAFTHFARPRARLRLPIRTYTHTDAHPRTCTFIR